MPLDEFRPIEIQDRETFNRTLQGDPPRTSELTFTNLFIWRHQYRPIWSQGEDCLLIILRPKEGPPFALPPVGQGNKGKALDLLTQKLKQMSPEPRVCRVDEELVERFVEPGKYSSLPDRDNADYVYSSQDLIKLSGRKYHRKKNHLNRFLKNYTFEYRPMDAGLVQSFFEMQESWCRMRECVESPELLAEDYAVHEALTQFAELGFRGGAILIDSKVEAFSLGEPLNKETAVIHIEKANPDIPGLYAAINQGFCQNVWSEMPFINREQDLGIEGLRKAKESYCPHHMVNKVTLIPK